MQTKIKNKLDQIRTNESGFALTEIMIVLVILGVLAAIAVPIFLSSQNNVKESDLNASLLAASTVIENEKASNNGLYPTYLPKDREYAGVTMTYTYSSSRFDYCLRGAASGLTRYIGSNTNGKVTATACTMPNTGGTQPGDVAPDGTTPSVSNNQPVIASLEPASITTRKAGTVITINGSGFLNGAVVLIDGQSINALVVNSNKLTFVSPGASEYKSLTLQVKNPNGRTSLASTLNLVNPVTVAPGNTAPATPFISLFGTASFEDKTELKLTSTLHTCNVSDVANAVPEYRFVISHQNGEPVPSSAEYMVNDGTSLKEWRTNNLIMVANVDVGTTYTAYVETRCTLEGQSSQVAKSESKTDTIRMTVPPTPTARLSTIEAYPYMVNKSTTFTWSPYVTNTGKGCPAVSSPVYMLFDGSTKVWQGTQTTSAPIPNGATVRTAKMSYKVICQSPWYTSPSSLSSPVTDINVLDAPPAPKSNPNIFRTDNGTSYSLDFVYFTTDGSSTCQLGTPEYRYEATTSATGGTIYGGWTATSGTPDIPTIQGYDYFYKMQTRCVDGTAVSAPTTFSPLVSFTSKVLNASTPTLTGSGTTATASGAVCTADAKPVYSWYLMDTTSNPPLASGGYYYGEAGISVNPSKNVALWTEVDSYYKEGDKVKVLVLTKCQSSNTAKVVTSPGPGSVTGLPSVILTMPVATPTFSGLATNPATQWFYVASAGKASGTVITQGSCPTGLSKQFLITNNKNSTVLNGTGPSFTTSFPSGTGTVTFSGRMRCFNPDTNIYSGYSVTLTKSITVMG